MLGKNSEAVSGTVFVLKQASRNLIFIFLLKKEGSKISKPYVHVQKALT
jgi:hypothetical protein